MKESTSLKGTLLVLISTFPESLTGVLVACKSNLSNTQKAFFCFLAGIIFLIIMFFVGKFKFRFNNKPLLIARGILGCTAIIIMFISIDTLGIGKGTVLYFTYPVFACLSASIFLNEKLTITKWIAVSAAFVGIAALYIKTGNDFYHFFIINRYVFLALLGGICGGVTVTIIRKCHDYDTTFSIYFSQSFIGVLMFAFTTTTMSGIKISFIEVMIICGLGLAGIFTQVIRTLGYRYTPVKNGSAVCMLIPILNIVWGRLFFDEWLTFNEITGAVVIIISCLVILKSGKNNKRCSLINELN